MTTMFVHLWRSGIEELQPVVFYVFTNVDKRFLLMHNPHRCKDCVAGRAEG